MAKRYCDGCGRPLEAHQTFCTAACAAKARARVVQAALEHPPAPEAMLQDKDLGDFLLEKYYGAGSAASAMLKLQKNSLYGQAQQRLSLLQPSAPTPRVRAKTYPLEAHFAEGQCEKRMIFQPKLTFRGLHLGIAVEDDSVVLDGIRVGKAEALCSRINAKAYRARGAMGLWETSGGTASRGGALNLPTAYPQQSIEVRLTNYAQDARTVALWIDGLEAIPEPQTFPEEPPAVWGVWSESTQSWCSLHPKEGPWRGDAEEAPQVLKRFRSMFPSHQYTVRAVRK